MGADPPERVLVLLWIAPPQVDVEHVTRQLVGKQPVGPSLNERQTTEPREHVVCIIDPQRVPQEGLSRHARERADLQRPALVAVWHDIEELSQQGCDQVRRCRVEGHAPTSGHIDQQ